MIHACKCSESCVDDDPLIQNLFKHMFYALDSSPNFKDCIDEINRNRFSVKFNDLCHKVKLVVFTEVSLNIQQFSLNQSTQFLQQYINKLENNFSEPIQKQHDIQIAQFAMQYFKQKQNGVLFPQLIKKFLLDGKNYANMSSFEKLRSLKILKGLQIMKLQLKQRNICLDLKNCNFSTNQLINNLKYQINQNITQIVQKINQSFNQYGRQNEPWSVFYKSFLIYFQNNTKDQQKVNQLKQFYNIFQKLSQQIIQSQSKKLNIIILNKVNQKVINYLHLVEAYQFLNFLTQLYPTIKQKIKQFYLNEFGYITKMFMSKRRKSQIKTIDKYQKIYKQIELLIKNFYHSKNQYNPLHLFENENQQNYKLLRRNIAQNMKDQIHKQLTYHLHLTKQQIRYQYTNLNLTQENIQQLLNYIKQFMKQYNNQQVNPLQIFIVSLFAYLKDLGKKEECNRLILISQQYKNIFDTSFEKYSKNYNYNEKNKMKQIQQNNQLKQLKLQWYVFYYLKYAILAHPQYNLIFLQQIQNQTVKNDFKNNCELILQSTQEAFKVISQFSQFCSTLKDETAKNYKLLGRRIGGQINQRINFIQQSNYRKNYMKDQKLNSICKLESKMDLEQP